jgi:hypothetical protein
VATDDELIDIAKRNVAPATDVTHYFICSGNQSLMDAFYGILRVGAPAYGGSAQLCRATSSGLEAHRAEAGGVPFAGQRFMGSSGSDVATVADVLSALKFEAMSGGCSIVYVKVGPTGRDWVREVYDTLMGEAMKQGILPFNMFVTSDEAAADFLLASMS